jgi:hypothetical protein
MLGLTGLALAALRFHGSLCGVHTQVEMGDARTARVHVHGMGMNERGVAEYRSGDLVLDDGLRAFVRRRQIDLGPLVVHDDRLEVGVRVPVLGSRTLTLHKVGL